MLNGSGEQLRCADKGGQGLGIYMAELVGIGQRIRMGVSVSPLHARKKLSPGFVESFLDKLEIIQAVEQDAWFAIAHISRAFEVIDLLAKGAHVTGGRELATVGPSRSQAD